MTKKHSLSEWTDPRLVRECLAGNEQAWNELIRRYGPMIYGIARRYRLTPEDCVDAYGQVCRSLLKNLSQLRAAERLPGFVATTTQRACLGIIRANERRLHIASELCQEMLDTSASDVDPDGFAAQLLRGHMVRRALDMQDDRCKKLLWHLFFDPEQPEYAEISKQLSLPVASIGPTRSRCLEKFRRTLKRLGFHK